MKYAIHQALLEVEWTAQHGCGRQTETPGPVTNEVRNTPSTATTKGLLESASNVHCEMVIEMLCTATADPTQQYKSTRLKQVVAVPREGIPNSNNDAATNRANTNDPGQADSTNTNNARFGIHETPEYYNECNRVKRNRNLFTADQNVNRRSAIGTRQNPNGGRRGLECPEERDYYPYWRPSPFLGIAYLVDDPARCGSQQPLPCGGANTPCTNNEDTSEARKDWVGNAQGLVAYSSCVSTTPPNKIPKTSNGLTGTARNLFNRREWPNNKAACDTLGDAFQWKPMLFHSQYDPAKLKNFNAVATKGEGWEETKDKAAGRLKLLQDTKEAWIGYAENSETIASDFEYIEEEIKKVKKKYNLQAAQDDLKKRQDLYNAAQKKQVNKEIKAVSEKLEVAGRFGSAVKQIEEFAGNLNAFDVALKTLNDWMVQATGELTAIRDAAGSMLPEDRVARTMDLQEDVASKLEVLKANTATEKELFPQGDKPPQDARVYKDELNRITKSITELDAQTRKECDAYSEDVKYWAEYRTGIKEFSPWLAECEKSVTGGLSKPSDLAEVKALNDKVGAYDKTCLNYIKVLEAAEAASKKMTTHAEADAEVAALKERYQKVKKVSEEWVKKVDTLMKEWVLLDNTVTELNSWVAKDKTSEGETSSHWRRWSRPWAS